MSCLVPIFFFFGDETYHSCKPCKKYHLLGYDRLIFTSPLY